MPFLNILERFQVLVTQGTEGWYQRSKVLNDSSLSILGVNNIEQNDYNIYLKRTESGKEIKMVTRKGDAKHFIPYPEKYKSQPPDQMINDLYIAGTYTALDSIIVEVTFRVNGNITGYKNIDRYRIGYGSNYPGFDFITFLKNNKVVESYHWKLKNGDLYLYNYELNKPDDEGIGDLYMKLVRKKD